MAIENFFTTRFTIKGLEDIEETDKEEFGEESNIYYCYFRVFSGELESFFDGGTREVYQIWFDKDIELKQGMVVVIDSVEYQVSSVKNNDTMVGRNMSGNKHKKAIIYKVV
ncbi:hypothetical protein [Methanoculleus sp.]|uniref:hypothetical protein n=1 Tax=Methanoculleus sp. TaxID=90427 RepID=UPI0025FF91D2|nr:hypothetical protein [Methanoculleus sp.]MCK9318894.1 hypothetical protein [Methanoculleus sp.]